VIHTTPGYVFLTDNCNGRLTPHGQTELMHDKPVVHGSKMFRVMDAAQCLHDSYFSELRGTPKPRAMVFGLKPSASAVAPPLSKDAMKRTSSLLSVSDKTWKPRLSRTGVLQNPPLPGLWITLTRALDECKSKCVPPRPMTTAELVDWTGRSVEYADVLPTQDEGEWNEASAPSENL
jgi:hypothetical protein